MTMSAERWRFINSYARDVFGDEDDVLRQLAVEAREEGLPQIAVSADIGRFLMLLTSTTPGRLAVELGTLGGNSAIWIARGLSPGGKLITVEIDERPAAFAERQFESAGLADTIELRRGSALEQLQRLATELAPGSVDMVFVDADKREYPDYLDLIKPLVASGGIVVIDNVLGFGNVWIDDLSHPGIEAVDRMNRAFAADDAFLTTALAAREGLLVARRVSG